MAIQIQENRNLEYGPKTRVAQEKHKEKYRSKEETFKECCNRISGALTNNTEEYYGFRDILLYQRFLPGGRIQSAIGSPKETTAFNCFVSNTIEDSMEGIMKAATEAATTMRLGGGIGFDFSTIRPRGSLIKTLNSESSGAVSFMKIFDSVCDTIRSAGNRRGAMMGVLRVDHPDIEEFITVKHNEDKLNNFNLSVAITDEFMLAVENDECFDLVFGSAVYETVNAKNLWNKIMRSTFSWSEPGILFIDQVNKMNNLYYCENLSVSNPLAN